MCQTGSRLVEAVNLRKLWEEADKKARDWREAGEEKLLRQAFDAREGLKHCGWFDGRHAPRDGSRFLVCGWDSTGVFPCRWQMGHFMVEEGGDLWPVGHVAMWKPMPSNAGNNAPPKAVAVD